MGAGHRQGGARCANRRQLVGPGAVGVERFGFGKLFGRSRAKVCFEITGIVGDIAAEEGIDVDRIATAEDDGVKTCRRPIQANGCGWIIQPLPGIGLDLWELGC